MEIKLYDQKGKKLSAGVAVPAIFSIENDSSAKSGKKRNIAHILYEVSRAYLANQRSGTASTKSRGEVSGGSKKPWRQKHTGNARAGSTRSPLWRKGGIIFGPKPKKWHIEIPRAKKRLAVTAAISEKIKDGALILVEKFDLEKPKTKVVAEFLKNAIPDRAKDKPIIFADAKTDPNFRLASRNIPNFEYKLSVDLNGYEIMRAYRLIITRAGFDALISRLASKSVAPTKEESIQ